MMYSDAYEIWLDIWHRVRIFNQMTGREVPDMYKPKRSADKESLMGMRQDLDRIVKEYDVLQNGCSFRFYISMRERIEALSDIVDYSSDL